MAENNTVGPNPFREDETSFSIAELWALVWTHKWWYVASLALFLAAGLFYLYRTPKQYVRTAKVLIDDSDQDATMRNLGVISAGAMRMRGFNSVENEMEALASPDLMQTVVERLALQTSYSEIQPLRKVGLYRDSPIEMRLAGSNPLSGFSFDVFSDDAGGVVLSRFRIRDEDIDTEVYGDYGDTLQTPVGAVVIYPVETGKKSDRTIRVSWSNSMAVAEGYCRRLNLSLSGKESSVIVISLDDTYPSRASSVISTLIDVYNEVWITNRNRSAINTAEFINERLVVIERDLAAVEEALKQYKSSNNLTDIKTAAKTYIDESSLYSTKAFEVSNQISIAEFIRTYLNDPANSMNLIPSNLGLTNSSVETQIKEYNEIVLQRDRLMAGSGANNPLIADMNVSLAAIRSAILRSVENFISTLNLQLAKIESQERQILDRMSSSSGQELQLLSIERQQQITQNLYIYLLEKREENELAALINVGNTRVIMNPTGPSRPVEPDRMMILFIVVVLGLGLPFGVSFLVKMFDTTIRNKDDLGSLPVPFLAELPCAERNGSVKKMFRKTEEGQRQMYGIIVEQGRRDMMNEAFRVLRTNVDLMLGRKSRNRVIMVTSFNPNAGKTFTVKNLAAGMALKGAKVMLVDLDLRKASLSRDFDLVHTGVASVLNGKVDDYGGHVDEIARNLYILPVGTLPPNPTELLLSDRFAAMIEHMRGEYDYIFLDCPPIDLVADASIITQVADMSVFVMRAGQMDKRVLPQIRQLYADDRYRHMALILNCVDVQYKKYGYGSSGYGYGYGYAGPAEE